MRKRLQLKQVVVLPNNRSEERERREKAERQGVETEREGGDRQIEREK